MAQLICTRCRQPVQATWQLCPYCGQQLTQGATPPVTAWPQAAPAVVQLACPACGGMLPLPTATTEYATCPYCQSTLYLRRNTQGFNLELVQQVGQAIGVQVGREVGRQVRAEVRQHAEEQRAYKRQAVRRAEGRQISRETTGMFLGCLALYGFLLTFAPVLLRSGIGSLLLLGAGFGALLTIFVDVRRGISLASSLGYLLVSGLLIFAFMYGFMWWFTTYLPANGSLFGPFHVPTSVPKP